MKDIKQLLTKFGLTLKLYLLIFLSLAALALLQWQPAVVNLPIPGSYAYQYGVFHPWLDIYKTADLGKLHVFQALTTGDNFGTDNWLLYPGVLFLDALIIFIWIGIIKSLFYRKKLNLLYFNNY